MEILRNRKRYTKKKYYQSSITVQLMLLYGIFVFILTAATCYFIAIEFTASNQRQADLLGKVIGEQTAHTAADMLVDGDRLGLSVLLSQVTQNAYVKDISLYSIDGKKISYATSKNANLSKISLNYVIPISYQDVIAGYIHLNLNPNKLFFYAWDAVQSICIVSILLLISGLLCLFFYGEKITHILLIIERQMRYALSALAVNTHPKGVLDRISVLAEQLLQEKQAPQKALETTNQVTAIISLVTKNKVHLQQILAEQDSELLTALQVTIYEKAAEKFQGVLQFSPEGNSYLIFAGQNNKELTYKAICSVFFIYGMEEVLFNTQIARLQISAGLCFSKESPVQFMHTTIPSRTISPFTQAFQLANISEKNQVCLFSNQLNRLPNDIINIETTKQNNEVITIHAVMPSEVDDLRQLIEETYRALKNE